MIKDAKPYTLSDILSKKDNDECFYIIPPYQRAYSWTKTEWEELFNDLLNNDKGYFLGSVICIGNPTEYKVIDGQQRLTTLSILLLSVYKQIELLKKEFAGDMNDDNLGDYLWLKKSIFNNKYRLTPSIQNENQKDWEYLVQDTFGLDIQNSKPSNFGNRRIARASDFLTSLITQQVMRYSVDEIQDNELKKQAFFALFDFVAKIKSAMLIRIETNDEQSAFLLFESLNNRGLPLSAIDLIKSKVLEKMGGDVEKNNEKWQRILNNIGEQPTLHERFLRHFYMTYADILPIPAQEKDKDGHLIIPKVSRGELIDFYNKQINANASYIFNGLVEKSKIYGLLLNPDNLEQDSDIVIDKKYQLKLTNLANLGISSAYMLLSFVFEHYKDKDFIELLDYLEFWFICRHATNMPPTSQLDKIFVDIVQSQKKEYNFDIIKIILDKFLDKINIEIALKKSNIYDTSALVRNILIRLEQGLRTKQTSVDFWEKGKANKFVWTIEHIYPQQPKNENDWGDDEQNKLLKGKLHSLGNLTLTCYNGSYSNKKYAQKCSIVDDGKAVGLINGDMKINQTLPKPSDIENAWTATQIDERTEWLINEFLEFIDKT